MGQGLRLWCTRNGLNGGQPDSGGQQVVHPNGVDTLQIREGTLYAHSNVP